ncbi:Tad domain-containing protein [Qipengyuania sp. XHP0207]|uniref:Tad domain-containing protein n=1 Tax=Qipengyuania sp. XHP0207 TaxID=3038078 RepID=UPI00241F4E60|nr:Tad domain-containing protein [Qipengyuania sp. XHP0207]MDG5747533.1 Tad domain-containing protein [Qipengyuania sp. XHP0207]
MIDRMKNLLRDVREDKRGNVLTLMGLSMIPMIGTLGLAVDVAQWISWKRDLRSAADSAAMAGGVALKNGGDGDAVNAAVRNILGRNQQRSYKIDTVEWPPSVGKFAGDKSMVRVVLSTQNKLPFSSLFLKTPPVVSVEAIAQASSEVANCMIALSPTGFGLSITGSASVDMNCGLQSNGNFDATSSDMIRAGALSAVGYVNEGNRITSDTRINTGVGAETDPFANKISDPNEKCNNSENVKGSATLSPGCYKGIRVNSKAHVTLLPGTYYIGSGGLVINAQATVIGKGVTIVYTNTDNTFNASAIGTASINGSSTVQLTAPETGPYAGIIMHQDSRTPAGNKSGLSINGNNDSEFEGAIYAPSNDVHFSGNSSMKTDCLQIVAQYITFTGNTSVANTCKPGRGVVSFAGSKVLRLRQ